VHRLSSAFVLAYHGCDRAVGERLLAGTKFKQSENDYDWLGSGIYFWESNPQRGLDFACESATRKGSKIREPYVVGAVVDLGACLDLTTANSIALVRIAYESVRADFEAAGQRLPSNSADGLRRKLDCLVLNRVRLLQDIRQVGAPIQTVKGVFTEGRPAYEGGKFLEKTHIQIAVCDPSCIKGVFRVTDPVFPAINELRTTPRIRSSSNAPEIVHATFDKIVGRTVEAVHLQDNRSKSRQIHHDETLTIVFTDGSRLVVQGGSNAGNLMGKIAGFKASDLSLSYVPRFHAAPTED
jgi:hypothetical protein